MAAAEPEGSKVGGGEAEVRYGVRDELPSGATALRVERERPAFRVAEAFVLVAGDVAAGRDAIIEELRADVIALMEAVELGDSGPEQGLSEPMSAEGSAEVSAAEVKEKQLFEQAHFAFMARDNEAREKGWEFGRCAGNGGRLIRVGSAGEDSARRSEEKLAERGHAGIIGKIGWLRPSEFGQKTVEVARKR